jgi:hypothetical protein
VSRKPDTRLAAMMGIARRELGMKSTDAARACGRSMEILTAQEVGTYRMSDDPTRKLILHYLEKLERPAPQPMLPLGQLVEQLAVAILMRRARKTAELLAAAESGADAVVLAVVMADLHTERWTGKVIRRLRYRLDVEQHRRVEEAEISFE